MLHLFVGQFAKAGEDHQQVGRIEGFQSGNVLRSGIDEAGLRIDGEQHRTLATVVDGEDLGQLRDQFFAAVLIVGGNQHDVLARRRAGLALQHHARRLGPDRVAARSSRMASDAAGSGRRCGIRCMANLGLEWNEAENLRAGNYDR